MRKVGISFHIEGEAQYHIDGETFAVSTRDNRVRPILGYPNLRVLRSQLDQYITEELGAERLSRGKNQTELRKIKKEMAELTKRLAELLTRRTEIERAMKEGK